MRLNKIEIVADRAHFKVPMKSQIQSTHTIPPISTIVGILQNLYGEEIDDFILGYIIEHKGVHREIENIVKEINPNVKKLTDSKRFITTPATFEYLVEPRLVIYTDIDKSLKLRGVLNLGKTNCLAKLTKIQKIELIDQEGKGFNQYVSMNMNNSGMPKRINTLTQYNQNKGYYDIFSTIVVESEEFSLDRYYDIDEEQNIFLWKWNEGGILSEFS